MMVTKRALPRRTFLRGLGATVALPLLDAMIPAFTPIVKTAAKPICRLGFLYRPNGVARNHAGIDYWKPTTAGTDFELSKILAPAASYRNQMVVVSGLCHPQAEALGDGGGDHSRASASFLNGVHPKKTEGADVRGGITADQIAAEQFGRETLLPSLELSAIHDGSLVGQCETSYSCVYSGTISWRNATTPMLTENDPRAVFERLFGEGGNPSQQRVERDQRKSLLDSVTEDMKRLLGSVGARDRARTMEYLDAVREIERRVQMAEAKNAANPESLTPTYAAPTSIPELYTDHVKLMFDLQWLAFQADLTRVFTFLWEREVATRAYPEIGITESHHAISHHANIPETILRYSKIGVMQTTLFAHLLERMRSTPEGDGTLLDNTLMLEGSGFGNPNLHTHIDIALAVWGGGAGTMKGGRHLALPMEKEIPMTNLLLTMLEKAGVQQEKLGDSTGPIVEL